MSHLNLKTQVLISKLRKLVSYIYLIISFPPSAPFSSSGTPGTHILYFLDSFSLVISISLHLVLCFQILLLDQVSCNFSQELSSSPSILLLNYLIGKYAFHF
jgi:hypothetical protein